MIIYTIYHNYNVFKTCINANSFLRTYHKLREYFVKKPSDKPDRRGLLADFPKSKRKLFEGCADTLIIAEDTPTIIQWINMRGQTKFACITPRLYGFCTYLVRKVIIFKLH